MRRLIALALTTGAVAGIACASAGAPPGGPEDHAPPQILSVTPESGQTNVRPKEVEFRFDEVVSDRGTGATAVDQLFLISPRIGAPDVSWHRRRITVKPGKGFLPNTAYRITVLPGLADLRGNVRKDGATVLFSTGAGFPPYSILGVVFDWVGQQVVKGAYVEAVSHPDTNVVYVAATDSAGDFEVGPLPAGEYTLRAMIDQNSNRTLDRNEKWDSATVTVSNARPVVELDAIERDTVPPAISNIEVVDSVTLRVTFDKPIDPVMPLQPALVQLQRSDSTPLEVTRVQRNSVYEEARRAQAADSVKRAQAADSVKRAQAADSARRAQATDSSRRADSLRARQPAPPPAARPAAPPAAPSGGRAPPPPRKPKNPPPDRAIVISVAPRTPMVPGQKYSIRLTGLRNLVGKSSPLGPRSFNVAVPKPAPGDTARRPPADSARKPPGAG